MMDKDISSRNTKQRKQLLELLRSTKSHPNAFWLFDRMKPDFPTLSLSTVYRNLGILENKGELLRLPCPSFDRYDGNTTVHSHFYCRVCERVYDMNTDGIEAKVLDSLKQCPHSPEGCNIMFYGICENCNKTN
jgi:Fur family transcriptional regulator, peroxide stress response regulator